MHAVLHRSEMARSSVVHALKAWNWKSFKVVKQIEIRESKMQFGNANHAWFHSLQNPPIHPFRLGVKSDFHLWSIVTCWETAENKWKQLWTSNASTIVDSPSLEEPARNCPKGHAEESATPWRVETSTLGWRWRQRPMKVDTVKTVSKRPAIQKKCQERFQTHRLLGLWRFCSRFQTRVSFAWGPPPCFRQPRHQSTIHHLGVWRISEIQKGYVPDVFDAFRKKQKDTEIWLPMSWLPKSPQPSYSQHHPWHTKNLQSNESSSVDLLCIASILRSSVSVSRLPTFSSQ